MEQQLFLFGSRFLSAFLNAYALFAPCHLYRLDSAQFGPKSSAHTKEVLHSVTRAVKAAPALVSCSTFHDHSLP